MRPGASTAILSLLGLVSLAPWALTLRVVATEQACLGSDEAAHAVWAAAVRQDIADADLPGLLKHLYLQDQYPAAYSLMTGLLLPERPSERSHRFVTCLWLVPCALAWAACAALLATRPAARAPAAVLIFTLGMTAPLMLAVASEALVEAPGLTAVGITYALFLLAERRRSGRLLLVCGIALVWCWFCKWQFGFIAASSMAAQWFSARPREQWLRSLAGQWGRLFGPSALVLSLWLFNRVKLTQLLLYLRHDRDPGQFLGQATYRAGSLPELLCGLWPVGLAIVLAALLGAVAARRWRTLPLVHLALAFLGAAATGSRAPHIVCGALPPLWLLAGLGLERLADWPQLGQRRRSEPARLMAAVVALLVVGCVTGALRGDLVGVRALRQEPAPAAYGQLYAAIARSIRPDDRLVTIGLWNGPTSEDGLRWWVATQPPWAPQEICALEFQEFPPHFRPPLWRWLWEDRPRDVGPADLRDRLAWWGATVLAVCDMDTIPRDTVPGEARILGAKPATDAGWQLVREEHPLPGTRLRIFRQDGLKSRHGMSYPGTQRTRAGLLPTPRRGTIMFFR